MEDGSSNPTHTRQTATPRTPPPPPPNPNTEQVAPGLTGAQHGDKSDEPLQLKSEQWDIATISGLAALHMLIDALAALAEATGDIPPTPPVSRPTTPAKDADDVLRRMSSPDTSSVAPYPSLPIGSPEAHPHEPIAIVHGADVEDVDVQHAAIARRFFSKAAPPFSLAEYLLRLHKYCPHSPGVYLAAATYCHRLCVSELKVPATNRTVHRLALAAIRISAKALEDNKWSQKRMSGIGGVSLGQLKTLEVALCFLLDFDLWVDDRVLARRMFLLQQASKHARGARAQVSDNFKLKIPARRKMRQVTG